MGKDIETFYGDFRFHNRQAARWAVFLDLLGIQYRYRPQTFKLTNLNDRLWTPDLCLPSIADDAADLFRRPTFIELFDNRPGPSATAAADHYATCEPNFAVYAFYGEVGLSGVYCYDRSPQYATNSTAAFVQCPFCGLIYITTVEEDGVRFLSSHCCVAACEFAKPFDIDPAFMDFVRKDQIIPSASESPMLAVARQAASRAKFESRTLPLELSGYREAIRSLQEQKVFCSTTMMKFITSHATELSQDGNCPRYWEPWYVAHEAHRKSAATTPCPCSHCTPRTTGHESASVDLAKLPAPPTTM